MSKSDFFIGDELERRASSDDMAVVHACKSPCHQRAVGYSGNLPNTHANYLWLRKDEDLYLNIIDPPKPLFPDELFETYMEFAREIWVEGKDFLIHCNKGESRAPSLALIFLAKHLHEISNDSFEAAVSDFVKLFPNYAPGLGLQTYLNDHWAKLDEL